MHHYEPTTNTDVDFMGRISSEHDPAIIVQKPARSLKVKDDVYSLAWHPS